MNSKWTLCTLGDLCSSVSNTYGLDASQVVLLNTSDVFEGKIINHNLVPRVHLKGQFKKTFQKNDILYSEIRPKNKRYAFVDIQNTENYIASTKLMVIRPDVRKVEPKYLYYLLTENSTVNLFQHLAESRSGTFPQITFNETVAPYKVSIPPKIVQQKIIHLISSFDDKIEINNKIIKNLENLMTCLFYEKCIKEHSCKTSLSKIANFLNGLAMQKYPPTTEDESLPVLKIRELRQTFCDDNSDLCSSKINPQYIVNDGDLIFSWSGSLLVDIWSGGKCGLNQHLFKVTSKTHPKWFVFLWIKFHIDKFIAIAQAKATTMGHIKRNDLDKAEVIHLDNKEIDVLDKIFKPQFDLLISLKIQNKALAKIRDLLLPKLLSGEIYLSN